MTDPYIQAGVIAGITMAEWVGDDKHVGHYVVRVRHVTPQVQAMDERGMPIVNLWVRTLCGLEFTIDVQPSTSKCTTCLDLLRDPQKQLYRPPVPPELGGAH